VAAFKDDKTGKWEVSFYYKDWQNNRKRKHKRGFLHQKGSVGVGTDVLATAIG
jgi:hypothetical protein